VRAAVSSVASEPVAWTPAAPPRRVRPRTGVGVAATVSLVVAMWWFLAPPQLGGATSFTTVDGVSMVPALSRSDLVALRPAASYRIGDVVGYRSALLGRVVLHRIAATVGTTYVLKGDHNEIVDPDRPTRADLVGSNGSVCRPPVVRSTCCTFRGS